MRISFVGAQGVGKTTLVNELKEWYPNYNIVKSPQQWIRDTLNLPINNDGTAITQKVIGMKNVYDLVMNENMITDRSTIDLCAYSTYLYGQGKLTGEQLRESYNIWEVTKDMYDFIFYLKPEFELVENGVRSTDKDFQREMADIFENLINKTFKAPVWELTGTVKQRLEQIEDVIYGK